MLQGTPQDRDELTFHAELDGDLPIVAGQRRVGRIVVRNDGDRLREGSFVWSAHTTDDVVTFVQPVSIQPHQTFVVTLTDVQFPVPGVYDWRLFTFGSLEDNRNHTSEDLKRHARDLEATWVSLLGFRVWDKFEDAERRQQHTFDWLRWVILVVVAAVGAGLTGYLVWLAGH